MFRRNKDASLVLLCQIGIALYIHSSYREGLHLKQGGWQKQTSPNAVDIDAHVEIIPASLGPVNITAGRFSVRWHYSRIVAELASESKDPHTNGCEPDVSLMQLIFKLAFECRPMQKHKHGIYVFKIQVNQIAREFRRWKLSEDINKESVRVEVAFPSQLPLQNTGQKPIC